MFGSRHCHKNFGNQLEIYLFSLKSKCDIFKPKSMESPIGEVAKSWDLFFLLRSENSQQLEKILSLDQCTNVYDLV